MTWPIEASITETLKQVRKHFAGDLKGGRLTVQMMPRQRIYHRASSSNSEGYPRVYNGGNCQQAMAMGYLYDRAWHTARIQVIPRRLARHSGFRYLSTSDLGIKVSVRRIPRMVGFIDVHANWVGSAMASQSHGWVCSRQVPRRYDVLRVVEGRRRRAVASWRGYAKQWQRSRDLHTQQHPGETRKRALMPARKFGFEVSCSVDAWVGERPQITTNKIIQQPSPLQCLAAPALST